MEKSNYVDLTLCSFDDFVSFLFNRAIPANPKHSWYYDVEVKFDPATICSYYLKLFRQPEFLSARFTKPQLEEGFWAIQGPNLACSVYQLIHETDLPLPTREDCIRSMTDLFERFFAKESLDTSVSMWWDSLCYDWHCGNRSRSRGDEDERLQDVFFQALSALLWSGSEVCQAAALHGLGHLHHPDTQHLIDRYIEEHPELTKERKAYALAAAKFEVL